MENEMRATLVWKPKFEIQGLADESPCVWGVFYLGGQALGIIWACPNGSAGFQVASRAEDNEDAYLEADKFRQQIFQYQIMASEESRLFDSIAWIEALPEDYSGMTGRSFRLEPKRLRFEDLEIQARTL